MKVENQIEYEAASDAEAIAIARERLGRDAVILSSKTAKSGGLFGMFSREVLKVTAGILVADPEDTVKESRDRMVAFQHLLEVRRAVSGRDAPARPAAGGAPETLSAFSAPQVQRPAAMTQAAAQAYDETAKSHKPQEVTPLAKDVDEIKAILATVLDRLGNGTESAGQAEAPMDEDTEKLLDADVDRAIAAALVNEHREENAAAPMREWLAQKIPTMGVESSKALGGRRILFAGPTGVGKTTTIAKIAAAQSLWEDKKVVLITADTYRIAAVEQLRTYAKILGIPLEVASEPGDISNVILKKHREADLILLDTAGRSHYDGSRMDELRSLYDAFLPDSVHLVLAANMKYRDMLSVIDRMGVVPLSALLFTKLDETATYGTILNVLRDFDLPVSFFTMGQNVPNDIEIARGERFVDFLFNHRVNEKG